MAVISFAENSSDAAWVVAGWAFRQVLADVLRLHAADPELTAIFEEAEAVGYLRIGCLEGASAGRVASAIKETAEAVLAGRIRSGILDRFNDEQTMLEYMNGLRMLLGAAHVAEGIPRTR